MSGHEPSDDRTGSTAFRGALYRRAPRAPWAVHLFASEELVLALRSRWTQIFAVVFGVLAASVAGAGYVLSGGHGVQDFARTAVSLVQLVLLLVPLTALVIGVLSLAPERGAAELVFSQPVSRGTILFGKLLGLFQALGAAQAVGFGVAGTLVYAQSGPEGLASFVLLVGASLVTTAVFLGLAALLAAGSVGRKRTRALALALVVWFVAVVFFDLAALGVASLLPSGTASRVLMVAAVVNPLGAVRTGRYWASRAPAPSARPRSRSSASPAARAARRCGSPPRSSSGWSCPRRWRCGACGAPISEAAGRGPSRRSGRPC